jgi:hypothetical protein
MQVSCWMAHDAGPSIYQIEWDPPLQVTDCAYQPRMTLNWVMCTVCIILSMILLLGGQQVQSVSFCQ